MFVVTAVADVDADVMKQRGVFEPLALSGAQTVRRLRLVEQRERHPCDLVRVLAPVVAAFGQFDHAPTPDVRVLLDFGDVGTVLPDVIQNESFTQGEVAERDFGHPELLEDGV